MSRPNEHLAVVLPRSLWKQDSQAAKCDSLFCETPFTLFERRHHCRRCGGVFCNECSARTTDLLDTSKLDFHHPPPGTPINTYESPDSPVQALRVCDHCFDQINTPSTATTPELVHSTSPISLFPPRRLRTSSSTSSPSPSESSTAPSTPPNGSASDNVLTGPPHMRRSSAFPRRSLQSKASFSSLQHQSLLLRPPEKSQSLGELDAYPLRRASSVCKATGGGRWQPREIPVLAGHRVPVPGGKAPYEIMLEEEAKEERLRRENPVIRDGEFQYRFPREPSLEREGYRQERHLVLSTF